MRIISCHRGLLQTLGERGPADPAALAGGAGAGGAGFLTGLDELDALPPRGAFSRGAVHEALAEPAHGVPRFFALLLARSAAAGGGAVVWSDPRHELYPPALAAGGLPLERVILLRPRCAADEVWALAECLRCRGVAAVVATPPGLSRVQARRLQLAAERGGGAGIFLRTWDARAGGGAGGLHYAAATRWRVGPAPGDRDVQRWRVQLVHGHGGRVGRNVILEARREADATDSACPVRALRVPADPVRAAGMLAGRSPAAEKPKVSA